MADLDRGPWAACGIAKAKSRRSVAELEVASFRPLCWSSNECWSIESVVRSTVASGVSVSTSGTSRSAGSSGRSFEAEGRAMAPKSSSPIESVLEWLLINDICPRETGGVSRFVLLWLCTSLWFTSSVASLLVGTPGLVIMSITKLVTTWSRVCR